MRWCIVWMLGGRRSLVRRTGRDDGDSMEPRVSLITLGVRDLDRSLRFYRDGLGLPTSWGVEKGVVFFRTSGTVLALYPHAELAKDVGGAYVGEGPVKFSGITLAHNVRTKGE